MQGNSFAQANLGWCYEKGLGVDKNVQKAVELYQEAVKQENFYAYVSLGLCYKNGIGVERDIQKAIELFQRAAEEKNAYGQYNLGWCYEKGVGVKQDERKAIELYQKAAEQGYIKARNKVYFFEYDDSSKLKKKVQELTEFYSVKNEPH